MTTIKLQKELADAIYRYAHSNQVLDSHEVTLYSDTESSAIANRVILRMAIILNRNNVDLPSLDKSAELGDAMINLWT